MVRPARHTHWADGTSDHTGLVDPAAPSCRNAIMLAVVILALLGGCRADRHPAGDDIDAREARPSAALPAPSTTPARTETPDVTPGTGSMTTSPTTPEATVSPTPPGTAPAGCPVRTPGVENITLTGGGADHLVRIFVPSAFDGAPLPTVIDWHGLGSNGAQQAVFTGYEALAEAEGFIVVHPTGDTLEGTSVTTWQLADPGDAGVDDLAFAGTLIDELIATWCAEPTRIYSTGMSNGGYFTARLVCEMGDRIAAAVSVAGTFHPDGCEPSRPVPYAAYHGTADVVVPFAGDGDSVLLGGVLPDDLRELLSSVVPDEFAEFAAAAGCAAQDEATLGDDVIVTTYSACEDDAVMEFFEITGGGHTWPGSPIADLLGGPFGDTTDTVDATRDGWAFMRRFHL